MLLFSICINLVHVYKLNPVTKLFVNNGQATGKNVHIFLQNIIDTEIGNDTIYSFVLEIYMRC